MMGAVRCQNWGGGIHKNGGGFCVGFFFVGETKKKKWDKLEKMTRHLLRKDEYTSFNKTNEVFKNAKTPL